MTPIRRRLLLGAVAGLAGVGAIGTAASARDPDQPDLKIAIRTDAGCAGFTDSLPPLVIDAAASAGGSVADVTICVQSADASGRFLTLVVQELVNVDPACTGDEASVDASCGEGALGELSDSLVQLVGVKPCRRNPRPDTIWERSLSELSANPLLLARRLHEDRILCVRLVLRYEPDAAASVVSQSDRATWRYSFTLNEPGNAD